MTTQKIKIGDTWYTVNEVIAFAEGDGGGGDTDHGLLSGLEGDDHTQYLTTPRGDARYLKLTGGTLSGALTLPGNPTNLQHAATKTYVDEGDTSHVADGDPHSQYLTPAEGDARYEALGDGMVWKGAWTSNVTYEANDVVRDDSWSMVANKTTADKPAPQPAGEPFNVYEGLDPTATVSSKNIIFGNRYSFAQGGYLTGYRIYTVAGNDYIVYSIKDPDGDRIVEQLLTFNAKGTGWNSHSISNTLVAVGTVVELICSVTEPPAAPASFVGDWDYSTPNNNGTPSSGEIIHSNKEPQSLRVDKDDITATDRDAELATLTVGDIIRTITGSWTIQGISSTATYYDFTITPTNQIDDGTQAFTFETVVATPIEFVSDTDYWLSSPYNAQGLYSSDGSSDGIVLDDNAYGVDITVQHALVSDDWDVLASPGSVGSSGGGVTDHGALSGLNDDDHPQYLTPTGHSNIDHTGISGIPTEPWDGTQAEYNALGSWDSNRTYYVIDTPTAIYRGTVLIYGAPVSNKPGPTNTGHNPATLDGTLTGSQWMDTADVTVENKTINGRVVVQAANVTFRNCVFTGGTASHLIDFRSTGGLVEDCTFLPLDSTAYVYNAVSGAGFTARRNDISGVCDGFRIIAQTTTELADVLIESNWVHDLYFGVDTGQPDNISHNDGVQVFGNGGITIRGNSFEIFPMTGSTHALGTSGFLVTDGQGEPQPDITITSNWFAGECGSHVNMAVNTTPTEVDLWNNIFDDVASSGQTADVIANVTANLTVPGLPATTGPDTNNGNVLLSTGGPVTISRWNP